MAFDLLSAKLRLSITGTALDVEIQSALDASLSIAEAYCKRQFVYGAEEAHYYHVEAGFLFVPRYPIEQVVSVTRESGQSDIKYKVNSSAGFLDLHGRYSDEELSVVYAGGYKVLPADLVVALFDIFDGIWTASQGSAGPTVGAIESVSLTGVGTVRMTTGGAKSAAVSSGAIPALASAILSNYKRYIA